MLKQLILFLNVSPPENSVSRIILGSLVSSINSVKIEFAPSGVTSIKLWLHLIATFVILRIKANFKLQIIVFSEHSMREFLNFFNRSELNLNWKKGFASLFLLNE